MLSAGLAFLLIAMVSSVLLITDYLLGLGLAITLTSVTAVFFLTFWAAIPWFRRNWIDEDAEEEDEQVSEGGPAQG